MHTPPPASSDRHQVIAQSALRILADHRHHGDRYTQALTRTLIERHTRPTTPASWSPAILTDMQLHQRAKQEVALRNGTARGLPTVFGELA